VARRRAGRCKQAHEARGGARDLQVVLSDVIDDSLVDVPPRCFCLHPKFGREVELLLDLLPGGLRKARPLERTAPPAAAAHARPIGDCRCPCVRGSACESVRVARVCLARGNLTPRHHPWVGAWGRGARGLTAHEHPRSLAHLGSLGSLLSVPIRLQSSCKSQTGRLVHGAETLPFLFIGLVNGFCDSSIPLFLTSILPCFCLQVLPTRTRTET
jgi:hypothetical protein